MRDSVAASLVISVVGFDGFGFEPHGGAVLRALAVGHLMIAAMVLHLSSQLFKLRAKTAVCQVSLLYFVLESGNFHGTLLIRVDLNFELGHR